MRQRSCEAARPDLKESSALNVYLAAPMQYQDSTHNSPIVRALNQNTFSARA
ncbi:hypothetical protein FIBSPDRAFT_864671, partial [Athelia psychrophila]